MEHLFQRLFTKNFTLLLLGQLFSLIGNGALKFALSMYVLEETGPAAVFGTLLAVSMVPTILLSPVGGMLADRIPRQRIMYVLDFITAAAVWNFALFGRGGSTLPPALLLLALSAQDAAGRLMGAFLPVCYFVLCGFEHCVANMYYVSAGLLAIQNPQYLQLAQQAGVDLSALTVGNFLLGNLLPVTLGNILGGAGLGALLWYAHLKKD